MLAFFFVWVNFGTDFAQKIQILRYMFSKRTVTQCPTRYPEICPANDLQNPARLNRGWFWRNKGQGWVDVALTDRKCTYPWYLAGVFSRASWGLAPFFGGGFLIGDPRWDRGGWPTLPLPWDLRSLCGSHPNIPTLLGAMSFLMKIKDIQRFFLGGRGSRSISNVPDLPEL